MRLFAFNVGEELVDMANFDPLGADVGTKVHTPYFVYLLEHPDHGPVLIDTGIDLAGAPPTVAIAEGEDVVSRLASVGVRPADVRHVVLSHLHLDHAGGITSFPEATFHVQARERAFALAPPVYQTGFYHREDFDRDVAWHEVDGETDLFGDGTVVLVPTPGHTAGHQSVLVRLPGGTVLLVADAAYSPRNLHERRLMGILWNPDAMVASWDLLDALAAREGAHLVFTHDLEWRRTVRLGPEAWYA